MKSAQIAIHELKAALSPTLARASAGEVIAVTSHGKVVARITGVSAPDQPGLAGLIASGAATWSGGKPALRPPVVLNSAGRSLSDIVIEDRG